MMSPYSNDKEETSKSQSKSKQNRNRKIKSYVLIFNAFLLSIILVLMVIVFISIISDMKSQIRDFQQTKNSRESESSPQQVTGFSSNSDVDLNELTNRIEAIEVLNLEDKMNSLESETNSVKISADSNSESLSKVQTDLNDQISITVSLSSQVGNTKQRLKDLEGNVTQHEIDIGALQQEETDNDNNVVLLQNDVNAMQVDINSLDCRLTIQEGGTCTPA